jgi:hypothetical protein
VPSAKIDSQPVTAQIGYPVIYNPSIDNFSASVVPVPAAAWLCGSALAGLGWMRQNKLFKPIAEWMFRKPSLRWFFYCADAAFMCNYI